MYGVGGDTVGGRNQNTADQFHMPTEKLTNSSELFPGQPILARRVDKKDAQEATLGVARRFAVSNTAAASKRSTGSTYPPCACGPQNVVSPVSPGSKQANLLSLSPREHSKNFMPAFFGNKQPHSGPQILGRRELFDRRGNSRVAAVILQGNAPRTTLQDPPSNSARLCAK